MSESGVEDDTSHPSHTAMRSESGDRVALAVSESGKAKWMSEVSTAHVAKVNKSREHRHLATTAARDERMDPLDTSHGALLEPNASHGANAPDPDTGKDDGKDKDKDKGDEYAFINVSPEILIRTYSILLPIVAIVCISFECVHRRWAGIDLSSEIDGYNAESEAGQGMRMGTWMNGVWPLTREFFLKGEMAKIANVLVVVLVFLSFFALFMDWARNIWQKDFWDAIEAKHVNRFWQSMFLFVLMAVVSVLSGTYQSYVQSILMVRWRATLTRNLQERWLMGRAFYTQHFPAVEGGSQPLDNPDQRLQEDVDAFIQGGIGIFFGFFMSIGRLALFTPILYMVSPNKAFGFFYCPGWLLYVSLIYAFFGSFVTHIAGRYLIPLSFIKQRVEADYRHAAIQVRDHTESIALYGSEETEHHRLNGRFDRIQRVIWEQMKVSKQLSFFRSFYFLSNDVAPFCILAGNYFTGQITLGELMQILSALGHVSNSLNSFVDSYTSIADFRATADRLYNFWVGVDKGAAFVESKTMAKEVSPPGDSAALYAQNVCVALPGDRNLWDNAGLVVQPGERVLLLGKDGCGKSVFLRSIAGCWPATGSVRIGRGDALFIPQKPFVPAGELREALAYPEQVSSYTDEEMLAALRAVGITALDDVPLSEVANWSMRLSGGEMQRLALAHALLRKPGLLVLDETTAAIGEEQTAELYAVLAKLLPPSTAVISVDHDAISEVGNWHNVHYTADPETRRWKLSSREVS